MPPSFTLSKKLGLGWHLRAARELCWYLRVWHGSGKGMGEHLLDEWPMNLPAQECKEGFQNILEQLPKEIQGSGRPGNFKATSAKRIFLNNRRQSEIHFNLLRKIYPWLHLKGGMSGVLRSYYKFWSWELVQGDFVSWVASCPLIGQPLLF